MLALAVLVAGALLALGAVGFAVRIPRGVAALFLVLAGVTPDVLRAVGAGPVSLSFWWTALFVVMSVAYVGVAATTPSGVVLPVEAKWAVALAGLALFSLAWSPARDVGARTWIQLVAPLALGLMLLNLPRTAPDGLSFATSSGFVPSMLTGGFAVCLVVAALGVPLGYTHMAELGLNTAVGPRTLAIYLSPLIILFCAGARFMQAYRLPFGFAALIGFGLLALSLSRTATVATLLGAAVALGLGRGWRLAFVGLVTVAIVSAAAIWAIAPLRERFGALAAILQVADARDLALGVSLTGRGMLWTLLGSEVSRHPWLGFGLGAAEGRVRQVFAEYELETAVQPHSELLRITYDGGVIALVATLWLIYVVWRVGARAVRADRPVVRWAGASLAGGVVAALGLMVTDNVLLYASFYTCNLAAIWAWVHRLQLEGSSLTAAPGPVLP